MDLTPNQAAEDFAANAGGRPVMPPERYTSEIVRGLQDLFSVICADAADASNLEDEISQLRRFLAEPDNAKSILRTSVIKSLISLHEYELECAVHLQAEKDFDARTIRQREMGR